MLRWATAARPVRRFLHLPMARRSPWLPSPALKRAIKRNVKVFTKAALASGQRAAGKVQRAVVEQSTPPPGGGDWIAGIALGPGGARRYHLHRPPGLVLPRGQTVPLLVMLHGCGQTGRDFAASTRMDKLAASGKFLVLYPEQDRLANLQGCWNWFERRNGKAVAEAATLMAMVDQVQQLYPVDRSRVAVAGLSAGAGMAALLATLYPARWCAVAMHSGVAPGAAASTATALAAMAGGRRQPDLGVAGAQAAVDALPPLLVLQGSADPVVAPANARAAAVAWALALDAQTATTRTVQRGKRYPVQVTDFTRKGRTLVSLVEITGLGHAWGGGAAGQAFSDPKGPDASRMLWAFVSKQFALKNV